MKDPNWFSNVEDREHPWPGLRWLTAGISVSDVRSAMSYYTERMGMISIAELENDAGEMMFARIRYRGTNFTLNKEHWDSDLLGPNSSGQPSPFLFYIYVDDLEKMVQSMMDGGAKILKQPEIMFWGDLKARLQDPFGYIWDIAQKV